MNHLPLNPLSPEEQQRFLEQMYLLMGKQVQSYHKERSMGSNSSVSLELARELMESMEYTIHQSGGIQANAEDALRFGQEVLLEKLTKARSMLELVQATAPGWQTQCRWEAIGYLRHYLDTYDHIHLAHRGPEELYYPILITTPEGIRGIDLCLFYLNIIWIENQIMAAIPDAVLDSFWDRLPAGTQNQCEHLLINCMGKALIGADLDSLTFEPEEQMKLMIAMLTATDEKLKTAARRLCVMLDLKDGNARQYVGAAASILSMWAGENVTDCNIGNIFL